MSKSTKQYIENPRVAKPWIYFLATYVWTWSFFGIAYWLGLSAETGGTLGVSLVLGALSGPAIMAAIFVKLALNKAGQGDYWKRVVDYKRISGKWYLAILLLIPTIGVISAMLSGYWQFFTFSNVTPSFMLTALVILFVPLAEELGWRGYILDRLQENYSAFTSSVLLGILWGFWHVPAFFLSGGGMSVIPFASLAFWEYMGGLTALSICMTWIYNNTNRSTLSAILFHMVLEFWADTGLFPWTRPDLAYHLGIHIGLWALVAVGITLIYGSKSLKKNVLEDDLIFQDNDNAQSNSFRLRDVPENESKIEHCHISSSQVKYTPYLNTQTSLAHFKNAAVDRNKMQNSDDFTHVNVSLRQGR